MSIRIPAEAECDGCGLKSLFICDPHDNKSCPSGWFISNHGIYCGGCYESRIEYERLNQIRKDNELVENIMEE